MATTNSITGNQIVEIAAASSAATVLGTVRIDQATPGTTDSVTVATGQGAGATIGTATDAVVVAGAVGSLSAKLRAISRDLVANIVLAAGSAIIGKVGIDQTTPGTTNAVQVAQAALTLVHTAATASNATSAMLALNAARKYALVQNDGIVVVYLKVGASAVANAGIRLEANGGTFEMSAAFGNLATGAINGITVSGTANVIVTEG